MSGNKSGWRFRLLVLAACAALALTSSAYAQRRGDRDHRGPPDGFRGPPGPPPSQRGFVDSPSEATAKKGFLFVDGEYLPPPYEIRFADESVLVNGTAITCLSSQRNYGGRGYGGVPRGGDQPGRSMVMELQRDLGNESVVIVFANQPYFVPDTTTATELLKSMTTQADRSLRRVAVREKLPEDFDKKVWDDWLDNFEPPEDLRQRAAFLINTYDEAQREALAEIRARQWLERLSYPLSVSGMLMSVLAIGHLLGGRPHAGKPTFGSDPSPEMIYALNWSLFFTAAFSTIDLAWTIAAANSNAIQELNPIGSQFIHDPRHLAGFKIAVTFSSLALLWLLRKHKRAQIAAWWVCLILTLVTCRWLMVNSLFTAAL